MDSLISLLCCLALTAYLVSGEALPAPAAVPAPAAAPAADPKAQKPKSFHGTKPDLSVLIKPLPNGLLRAVQDDTPAVMPIGSSFDLDCHITPGGDANANMQWLKNGRRFVDSARAKVIGWLSGNRYEDYQIRFFNFTHDDAAHYTCMAPQGSINATLGVPPYVLDNVSDVQMFAGDTLQLPCPVSAFPPVVYTWVDPARNVLDQKGEELRITDTPASMNGTFECEGRNSIGQASLRINVLVKERLQWVKTSPSKIVSRPLSTVQLECHASGYPRSEVLWTVQKHGRPLERVVTNETDGVLTLFMVAESMSGNYTCAVRSTLPCCPDEQAQPPLLRTIHLSVRESSGIDPPTPCPDGDVTCMDDSSAPSSQGYCSMLAAATLALASLLAVA
eukprot:scpid61450/ scgid34893/ Hemicentin-2